MGICRHASAPALTHALAAPLGYVPPLGLNRAPPLLLRHHGARHAPGGGGLCPRVIAAQLDGLVDPFDLVNLGEASPPLWVVRQ